MASQGAVLAHAAFTHTALVVLLYWAQYLKGFINKGLIELRYRLQVLIIGLDFKKKSNCVTSLYAIMLLTYTL